MQDTNPELVEQFRRQFQGANANPGLFFSSQCCFNSFFIERAPFFIFCYPFINLYL